MSVTRKQKDSARARRKQRIRKKVLGTAERPRVAVFRSLKHISVQVVDDRAGKALFSVSDLTPAVRAKIKAGAKKFDKSTLVGEYLAEQARAQGIQRVVFDRGGYRYHGRVKAVAEAARKAGMEF